MATRRANTGCGIVRVVMVGDSACLETLYSSYPIKLLPLAASDDPRCTQLYVIGHGGGLVSGDAINLQFTLENDSILVLKTQGSTKVYRGNARHDPATRQEIIAKVYDDAFLVSVPDPVTCFKDSKLIQNQVYRLSEQASCIIVDSFTSGRSSNGEVWEASHIINNLQLFINDKLVFMENLDLQPTNGVTISEKIGNCRVFGIVLLVGPQTLRFRDGLQSIKERPSFKLHKLQSQKNGEDKNAGMLVSISDITGGKSSGAVLRFSGDSVESAYCFLAELFKIFATDIKLAQPPYMDRVNTDFLARRREEW